MLGRYDAAGVEGSHSCLRFFTVPLAWGAANSNCGAALNRAHLLTSAQVRGFAPGVSRASRE